MMGERERNRSRAAAGGDDKRGDAAVRDAGGSDSKRADHADGTLVAVRGLKTFFPVRRGVFSRRVSYLKAVNDVTFDIGRGRTLGLVGESGCGKTTLGRTMLRLVPATAGGVWFDGRDLFAMDRRELRATRRHLQIVFQDPVGSLNPRMTVEAIVGEPLTVHGIARGGALRDRVARLLERVGLRADHMDRYPHEFSGGQRQRVGIARAIALEPKFIVCDEPVSALDVSIQSQILNLLADLQREDGLTYLFIAHNLPLVRHISDDVAVMYLGRIVEIGPADAVYDGARHPYTQALLASAPVPDPARRTAAVTLPGEVPSAIDPPSGCAFHPRCPFATEDCTRSIPDLEDKPGLRPGHRVACHHADQLLSFVDAVGGVAAGETPASSSGF